MEGKNTALSKHLEAYPYQIAGHLTQGQFLELTGNLYGENHS